MTWPIPLPDDITGRAAAAMEVEFARLWGLNNPGQPPATVDARSPFSTLAIHCRVLGMSAFDIWIYLQRLARELLPDTAVDWLSRHGQVWGVPRVAATAFAATATFAGTSVTIPSGLALSGPGGAAYLTTGGGTITGTGTISIAVQATVAGAAGTLPTSTLLTVVSPLAGLNPQTATIDADGTPGEDIEDAETWRGRIIARIRQRGSGGNAADFKQWVREVYPSASVAAMSPGTGLITVAFAMPSGGTWRAPTSGEIAAVSTYVNDATARKPLGAPFINVVAATIGAVAVTIHLNPDTAATRAAAMSALGSFILTEAMIGGSILLSRLDAALSNSSGETSHTRAAPSADVTAGATTLLVLGAVTFT